MSHSFYVVMQKRGDGKVYADIQKTNGKMHFTKEDAENTLNDQDGDYASIREFFHVVELVAETKEDWKELYCQDQVENLKHRFKDIPKMYVNNIPQLLLQCGEMTMDEIRTVKAVLNLCLSQMEKI